MYRNGQAYVSQTPGQPWSTVSTPARDAVEDVFEVRPGDEWPGDTKSAPGVRNRAELCSITRMPLETPVWVSYAQKLFSDAPIQQDPTRYTIGGQFHHTPDPGDTTASPPWATQFTGLADGTGAQLVVFCRSLPKNPGDESYIQAHFDYGVVPYDTWTHWVHRLTFSRSTGGHLASWRNGQPVFDAAVPLGYNDTIGPYFKFGIYRSASPVTTRIAYQNVECDGVTDLTSRITQPLPLLLPVMALVPVRF